MVFQSKPDVAAQPGDPDYLSLHRVDRAAAHASGAGRLLFKKLFKAMSLVACYHVWAP